MSLKFIEYIRVFRKDPYDTKTLNAYIVPLLTKITSTIAYCFGGVEEEPVVPELYDLEFGSSSCMNSMTQLASIGSQIVKIRNAADARGVIASAKRIINQVKANCGVYEEQ